MRRHAALQVSDQAGCTAITVGIDQGLFSSDRHMDFIRKSISINQKWDTGTRRVFLFSLYGHSTGNNVAWRGPNTSLVSSVVFEHGKNATEIIGHFRGQRHQKGLRETLNKAGPVYHCPLLLTSHAFSTISGITLTRFVM